jgi:hypothetical protein
MEKIYIEFNGGMNQDDLERRTPKGDYEFARNLYLNDWSNGKGHFYLAPGNELKENVDLPAGNNRTLKAIEWPERRAMVYFNFNSLGDHQIWVFYKEIGTSQLILQGPPLILYERIPIDADIRDGILYWTQGFFDSYLNNVEGIQRFSPPRKINLQKAIDFQNSSGGYPSIDWQTIEAAKYPYALSPSCQYLTNLSRSANMLKGRLFQFIVQYIYDDGEESRWSPISRLPFPQESETMGGNFSTQPSKDNVIRLSINTGHHTVRKIRVAVREGNDGAWGIFREIDKDIEGIADEVNQFVFFWNNEQQKPIEVSDQNYDLIPQIAKSQEILHNNELVYFNIVEGYDRFEPQMEASYKIQEIDNGALGQTIHELLFDVEQIFSGGIPDTLKITLNPNTMGTESFIPEGTAITITWTFGGNTETGTFITSQDYVGPGGLNQFFVDWRIYLNGLGHSVNYTTLPDPALQLDDPVLDENFTITVEQPNKRYQSWKTGCVHPVGIQYYDAAMRDGTVITNSDCRVEIKSQTEQDLAVLDDPTATYKTVLQILVSHQPPAWARYYKIVYGGNRTMLNVQQRSVVKAQIDSLTPGRVKLSLEREYRDNYAGVTYNKEIQVGDQVRILTKTSPVAFDSPERVETNQLFNVLQYELEAGENQGEAIWVEAFDFEQLCGGNEAFLIEIFTPKKQSDQDVIWFEISDTYNVQDPHTPNRAHVGQTPGNDVLIDVEGGDCYIRRRQMGSGFTADPYQTLSWYIEDFHYSDLYSSQYFDKGRPAIQDVTSERKELTNSGRASRKFIDETNVNGFSRFDTGRIVNLPPDYGQVTRVIEVGFTLKVICEQKVYSIYVDRQESFSGEEASLQYIQSTFGTVRPHEENWGSRFHQSIIKVDRALYYYDSNNRIFVECLSNGQRVISGGEYKMDKYFKEEVGSLDSDSDPFALTQFDGHRNKLRFTSSNNAFLSSTNLQTIVFDLEKRRWETTLDGYPTAETQIGDTLYTFANGEVYDNDQGLTMYGIERLYMLVWNLNHFFPNSVTLHGIEVLTNVNPGTLSLATVEGFGNMPGGHGTYVLPNFWKTYERKWASAIYGSTEDYYDNIAFPLSRVFNGDDIRGEVFRMQMDNFTFPPIVGLSDNKREIGGIIIHYLPSPQ